MELCCIPIIQTYTSITRTPSSRNQLWFGQTCIVYFVLQDHFVRNDYLQPFEHSSTPSNFKILDILVCVQSIYFCFDHQCHFKYFISHFENYMAAFFFSSSFKRLHISYVLNICTIINLQSKYCIGDSFDAQNIYYLHNGGSTY